jgi:hypothetical protein
MVILGEWISYVVEEKTNYIKATCDQLHLLGFWLQNPLGLISL